MTDDSEIVRSLTTVYGFFFVFMSVVAAGSSAIATTLDTPDALLVFAASILFALACVFIGVELLIRLYARGMVRWGAIGLMLLVVFVPVVFVLLVGKALLADWYWHFGAASIPASSLGVLIVFAVILLVLGYLIFVDKTKPFK